jgi:hypothetical protein
VQFSGGKSRQVADRLEPGTQIAGRYTILGVLGHGGTASVHHARDERLDTDVAIKVLWPQLATDQSFIERFRREARALARLSHPNIVRMFELGEDDELGLHYLVLEYMPGGSLKDRANRLPWTVDQVIEVLRPVASALDYAHASQPSVIHRDLKPSNILFGVEGRPVVGDFGLARLFAPESAETSLTGKFAVGTPMYMAPEQLKGQATPASDRYGLGVIAYELLVGRVPHCADTPIETLLLVASRPAPPARQLNPTISAAVEAVLEKALEAAPESRYRTASEFVEHLRACGRTLVVGPAGRAASTVRDVPSLGTRRPGLVPALAAVTGLALVVLVFGALTLTRTATDALAPTFTAAPTAEVPRSAGIDSVAVSVAATPVRVAATPLPTAPPTVAPTSSPTATEAEQWLAVRTQLDPLWGSDWPSFTRKLSEFVAAHPDSAPAKDKLYAALVEYGKDLIAQGSLEEADAVLQQAHNLLPDRTEALDAAEALTPTPTATPTLLPTPAPAPAPVSRVVVPARNIRPAGPPPPAIPPTKVPFQP